MDGWMTGDLKPIPRILMGPGPNSVHYRVYRAMATPVVGYMDPQLFTVMDSVHEMLKGLFQTNNTLTLALPGTGSAGMEASFVNFIEPGDTVIIGVKGFFGERMTDVAERCGARVIRIDQEWGRVIEPERVIQALKEHPETKICAIIHAETSTGVRQPLEEIGATCRKMDTLFLVDAVTSLGTCEVKVDDWGIDVCYSCSQKGIGIPPGLSPITVSPKAMEVLRSRKKKVQSWYLDLSMIKNYWGEERLYHHTTPVSMFYALKEGLSIIFEEGLEPRFERHQTLGDRLKMELEGLGFRPFAQEGYRLSMLTSAYLPKGVEDGPTRTRLVREYQIEVGGGLGPLKGKIWRVGLMGETCRLPNILALTSALKEILSQKRSLPRQPGEP